MEVKTIHAKENNFTNRDEIMASSYKIKKTMKNENYISNDTEKKNALRKLREPVKKVFKMVRML